MDDFWSRTQVILYHLTSMFPEEITTGKNLVFKMFSTLSGTFTTYYDGGLREALGVLTWSNCPGKHEAKQKNSSARKARLVHANIYMASASGEVTSQVIRSDKGLQVMASSPTDSECFTRFTNGLRSRIGERRNQDAAIFIALMIEIQQLLELEWQLAVKQKTKELIRTLAKNGSFQNFTYCGILRGYKTPKVLLHDLHHHIYLRKNHRFYRNEGIITLPTYLYPFWYALRLDIKRRNAALLISVGRPSIAFNQEFGHRD